MARYIDAEKINFRKYPPVMNKQHIPMLPLNLVECVIKTAPTADVEEVKYGKWNEKFKDGFWYYDCPFCDDGYVLIERDENKPNYCQNCGAKMDGGNANA